MSEEVAAPLDDHYVSKVRGDRYAAEQAETKVKMVINRLRPQRMRAQKIGALALMPFVGFLVWHAMNHHVPLFFASFAGFIVAFVGIANLPNVRKLTLHEARQEYAE